MLEEQISNEIQKIRMIKQNSNGQYIFEVIDEEGILNNLDRLELPLLGVTLEVIAKKDKAYHVLYENHNNINPYIKRIK